MRPLRVRRARLPPNPSSTARPAALGRPDPRVASSLTRHPFNPPIPPPISHPRDGNGDVVAWDVRARRPLWRLPAHTPSSGALHAELAPGSSARVLTQGRDGTLKCWRTSGAGADGDPRAPPRAPPSWTLSSGSYHYCKFATRRGEAWDGSSGTVGSLVAVAGETQSALDVCEMPSLNDDDDDENTDADADADTSRMGTPRRLASLIAAADREHASARPGRRRTRPAGV